MVVTSLSHAGENGAVFDPVNTLDKTGMGGGRYFTAARTWKSSIGNSRLTSAATENVVADALSEKRA